MGTEERTVGEKLGGPFAGLSTDECGRYIRRSGILTSVNIRLAAEGVKSNRIATGSSGYCLLLATIDELETRYLNSIDKTHTVVDHRIVDNLVLDFKKKIIER